MNPMIEMSGITKEFPGIRANDNISFSVNKGEIHALLGENGAGKSTLMSVLTGLYKPDYGHISINGKKVNFSSPKEAMNCGIGMVHQHFKLVQTFTAAENIMLAIKQLSQFIDRGKIEREIIKQSEAFGLTIDPKAKVWQLSVGIQQRVEIVKLLMQGAEILILDEPTAVLTPQETDALYEILHKMADSGKSIILISHKMNEVMNNTDRITVLRDGKSIGTVITKETSESELARMMVGRAISEVQRKKSGEKGKTVLSLSNISVSGLGDTLKLDGVSLEIKAGEILGVAGVDGNGQRELADVIAGLMPTNDGSISFLGSECTKSGRKKRIEMGIGYIPEDRMTTGLVTDLNTYDNVILKDYRKTSGPFINWKKVEGYSEELVKKFDVRLASTKNPVKMMSGGNIQKLLLAREIDADPQLIVAVYPMRGLDIGATNYVKQQLVEQSEKGKAIMLISEDLEDLLSMSDRIAVLYGGRIMGIVRPDETEREEIGLMMAGKRKVDSNAS